jgi:N-acetylglucosaminyl-diphospho-decaprenol L-rhamnosyltransferase
VTQVHTPTNAAPALAVIIVSYNTRELLRRCLQSLGGEVDATARVIVVDNASADGSAEMAASEFTRVEVIAAGRNLGFAGGNNLALRALGFESAEAAALPDAVLFLNPDTEVRPGAIAQLQQFLQRTPRAGVVGPALVYPDGRFQHSAFHFPTLWQIWFDFFTWPGRLVESPLNGRYPRAQYAAGAPFRVDHPLGAAFMVRAAAIRQVGLMDEGFFMYAEEIDWCLRARRAGWDSYCLPTAVVVHHSGGSTRHYRRPMEEALWRSRFRLFEKHYSPLFVAAARALVHLGSRHRARQQHGRPEDVR